MIRYHARWVLPMAGPPVRDGWVSVDAGAIVAVGVGSAPAAGQPRRGARDPATGAAIVDLGPAAILPGLVNAHTHLELSWMRGRVPPAPTMPEWVRELMTLRRDVGFEDEASIRQGVRDARAFGTALVGDITNTFASVEPVAESPLAAVHFFELLRFNPADPAGAARDARARIDRLPPTDRVRFSLAAHAPYSVSPHLFRALRAEVPPGLPHSVHLAESVQEIEFLQRATGPWRWLLEDLGAWVPGWEPPGASPVEYLDALGWLDDRALVAHGVQLTDADLERLARIGATLVTCPRSNAWTGAGAPPVARFYASGVRVAFGTDSLASAPDLNLFADLAEAHRLAPSVAPRRLLESATIEGARALGFGSAYGAIEPGKRADLIVVDVPPEVADVEEYLVGGVPAARIRWLPSRDEPPETAP